MKLEIRRTFTRDIRRIRNQSLLNRIERKIAEMESADAITEVSSVKKLTSSNGNHYHVRIGDYRLGLTIENEVAILVRFGHRRDIYQRFP